MGSSLQRLLEEKRRAVISELEALKGRAAEIASDIQVKEAQLRNITELLSLEAGSPPPEVKSNEDGTSRSSPLLAATYDTLGKIGRPMHYTKLSDALARQGVYVPGKNPPANLLAHMSRDARFKRFGRGIYGLQQWPSTRGGSKGRRRRRRSSSVGGQE